MVKLRLAFQVKMVFFFNAYMQDWLRQRFPESCSYALTGLHSNFQFDILEFFTTENKQENKARVQEGEVRDQETEIKELINKFCMLKPKPFIQVSERIIDALGFTTVKDVGYREGDGVDYIARSKKDKKTQALIRIRQWENQPISDIFIREQQEIMGREAAQLGFIIAGANLTSGAEMLLKNMKNITVLSKNQFTGILKVVTL